MGATDIDLAAADRLLTTTRTVRKRLDLDRPVERAVIMECISVATQAPTGSNLQGWRWVVVTDAAKRAAIGELYRESIEPYHAIMSGFAEATAEGKRVYGSSNYLVDALPRVPVHVIPCLYGKPDLLRVVLEGGGYPLPVSDNMAHTGFYGSIWPAVWSFMLAARARGLGSALTTMHLGKEKEVGELLGIPDTATQIGLIPVAYYTGDGFKAAARRPADEITHWDGWNE